MSLSMNRLVFVLVPALIALLAGRAQAFDHLNISCATEDGHAVVFDATSKHEPFGALSYGTDYANGRVLESSIAFDRFNRAQAAHAEVDGGQKYFVSASTEQGALIKVIVTLPAETFVENGGISASGIVKYRKSADSESITSPISYCFRVRQK